MCIVRKLDAGPVADVERVRIEKLDTALEVEGKLSAACVPLVARALPRLIDGALTLVPQDDARATFCRKLVKDDGALDFSEPASVLAARINGLFPWPSCSIEIAGQSVKIGLAETLAVNNDGQFGQIVKADGDELILATGSGSLKLLKLQRPGGKMLSTAEFLRGFQVRAGDIIQSRPMPVLTADQPFRQIKK